MIHGLFSLVTRHALSMLGAVVALVSALVMVMLFAMQLSGFEGGAYLGIVTYVLLPMFLVLGLVLIPIGAMLKRRQEAAALARHERPPLLPVIDLNDKHTRGVVLASIVVGMVALVLVGGATYKGVEVMDSVPFCGTVCHTVMQPEYTAFLRSPHSRLRCADCHIGSGADWFVKSKLSGSWQLISVAFNLYPRPIPDPVRNLRPARETCEQCHWPTRHVGEKLRIVSHFADDEKNSETKTVMLLKVGGMQAGKSSGIHWHVDRGVKIRYLSDPSRQKIYEVEMHTADGKVQTFKSDKKIEGPTEWRTMDCIDCHNRPSHTFKLPGAEIDAALSDGRIDKTLPFIKHEGMRVLQLQYSTRPQARQKIAEDIDAFYKTKYPDIASSKAAEVTAAGKALGEIYSWNVFPAMNVTWGTYPNNLGHEDSPGCFRCHDNKHRTDDGNKIVRKCGMCHTMLADDEPDPAILKELNP